MDEFDRRVAVQLGRRVKRRRRFLDLSQEVVAERAGIHRTQISLYETGSRMPLTASLVRLAAALEISVEQLLVGVEWEVGGSRAPKKTPPEVEDAAGGSDREVAQRFGDNLRRVRKSRDFSQERLARLAGLHRTEIGFLEKGERVCRIDTLIRLAGAMSVPATDLLYGIEWIPGPEAEGTYTFIGEPRPRQSRQPSSPP